MQAWCIGLTPVQEYGFAQSKDSLSKETSIKEVVVVALGSRKRRNYGICTVAEG